jgi:hypothetical protein
VLGEPGFAFYHRDVRPGLCEQQGTCGCEPDDPTTDHDEAIHSVLLTSRAGGIGCREEASLVA